MRWLLLLCTTVAGASLQEVGKLPEYCYKVQFLSGEFGWCNGVGIQVTVDGGRSWNSLPVPKVRYEDVRAGFLNPQQGWLASYTHLFWTNDGGSTWEERMSPPGPVEVRFLTPDVGVATAWLDLAKERRGFIPAAFRTRDGGRSWIRQSYGNREIYQDLRDGLGWLEFADLEHGLSVELNATLFTHDGGRTWKKSRYCPGIDKRRMRQAWIGSDMWGSTSAQLLDAEYGWWTVEGDLFRTTDGGETWCKLPPIRLGKDLMRIRELHFVNRTSGWAVLNGMGFSAELPITETQDGGQSWKPIKLAGGPGIYGMSVVSESVIFVWNNEGLYRLIRD